MQFELKIKGTLYFKLLKYRVPFMEIIYADRRNERIYEINK